MEEPKLDHISDVLMNHLHTEAEKGTKDGSTPLEAIQKLQPVVGPKQKKRKVDVLDLDGFHLYNEPMTLLFFRLVQLKNEAIDTILTEANFTMADIAGKPIFPRAHNAPKS